MNDWIQFRDRVPTEVDAKDGMIVARLVGGRKKLCTWDLVPTLTSVYAWEVWEENGFTHWKKVEMEESK